MTAIQFFAFLVGGMVFLAVLNALGMPAALTVVQPIDLLLLSGSVGTIASACVIVTGVPCAVALGVVSGANILYYIVLTNDWVKLAFITPVMFLMIYALAELARGK